jgi:alpha/beta superfamily hydrolase
MVMPASSHSPRSRSLEVEPIRFATQDGLLLEGEIRVPDGPPRAAAVLCHPHPQHGGSKDHPLLWALRSELARTGFAVLSFNFRGVMGSEGTFGGGLDEVVDVWAAVGRAQEVAPGPVFLCGWSFGARVALQAAVEDDRIARLALVGLSLRAPDLTLPPLPGPEELRELDVPVLLLAGSEDPFAPSAALRELERAFTRATVTIVPGADHYFAKREREAAGIVARFAASGGS